MTEYEIHISANYMTSGGMEEDTYFVEYVTAENKAEGSLLDKYPLAALLLN